MNLIQSETFLLLIKKLLRMFFIFGTLFMILPILVFITMFSHEGGHGIIVVPAIILNHEIPEVPTEDMQENPFRNFPLGIFSLFLAFPLGILANGFLSYLSIKNAKRYQNTEQIKDLLFYTLFISFCILNFSGVLTNLFGQDFAFIIQDILKISSDEQWFKSSLRLLTYIVFPLLLAKKYQFTIYEILLISGTTFLVYYTIVIELIIPSIIPILMANFWWLFIIGLLILICTTIILIRNSKSGIISSETKMGRPILAETSAVKLE